LPSYSQLLATEGVPQKFEEELMSKYVESRASVPAL
jgi:hypothetical protein